jgi:glutamate N-acetyltransferase/amino-acid N-acetyltransferase
MIYPDLKTERHATMLCFITTDAAITKKMLEQAADKSLAESFHMISVDGDMSTNDTCFILANGLAGNKMITAKTAGYGAFLRALKYLMKELAREMVMDGEGATKLVEIEVKGAAAENDARTIARKISTSNLFKCCVYGEDPNWGRIAASAGASGVDFDPNRTDIYLGSIKVMSNGQSIDHDKRKTRELFRKKMIPVTVDLKSGGYSAIALTCDLSHSYVDINAEYST